MKKIVFTVFVLLALLAGTTGTAFAGSAWELVKVSNDVGGPKFTFHVNGEFSKDELNSGFVTVEGGETYPLYCVQVDAETVKCHTSKKVGGNNVVVGFGGIRAWVKVPAASEARGYCYPVYDWDYGTEAFWALQGNNCQENEAHFGDWIYDFYAPDWDAYFDYMYLPGDFCGWADPGAGYYYPWCPLN